MKIKNGPARDRTRRVILEAMADVVTDTNGIGFTVQAVADRAGVTHRTIYNHFPTRESLCEGFSDYVDEVLLTSIGHQPDDSTLEKLPGIAADFYQVLAQHEKHARAYVMLMIGNRRPVKTWRTRTRAYEKLIAQAAVGTGAEVPPKLVTAAVRMFASSMGWHLLTEQCGLSTREAAAAGAWATRTLLEAATRPTQPQSPSRLSPRGSRATRRPRT